MGLGPSRTGAFTALIPCLPMFFSTWETYHTHTLYLGYFNGPTEGLLIATVFMLVSAFYGPQIWKSRLSDILGHPELFEDTALVDVWVPTLLISFFVAHLPSCVYNVVKARRRENLPILPVFFQWAPMLVFTSSTGTWLFSPYSTLLTHNRLLLFCLTMSFVFGRLTTKIILHHLTRQAFPYWTILLVPLVGGSLIGNLPRFGLPQIEPETELYYLSTYFVFSLVVYFRWALLVINTICAYLNINCLTIPSTTASKDRDGKKASPNGFVSHAVKEE